MGCFLIQRSLFAALCGMALAGSAVAQNQPAAKPASLTDAQKLEKSAQNLEHMKSALKRVLTKVDEARSEKDVVKLNCVNEKLTQVKGLLKVAEQSDIALHEALSAKDPAADAEFTKIGIARSKVEALQGDAEQCIGQLAYIVDDKTTVEVQQPQGLPEREGGRRGWRPPAPPGPPVRRPRPASSFQ